MSACNNNNNNTSLFRKTSLHSKIYTILKSIPDQTNNTMLTHNDSEVLSFE